MKRLIAILALLSGSLWAQSTPALDVPASKFNGPSYSQLHCSGFITRKAMPRTNYVVSSKEAPHPDQFMQHAILFLGGPGLTEGERYSLIRQVEDPNREDSSPEQRNKLGKLGKLYQEVGWVTVHTVQKGTAIASFDFACDVSVPGDLVVPFHEVPELQLRARDPEMNSFRPAANGPTGHILGSKDFVGLLGTGVVVYTDFGGARGVQPGDYLYIRRGYADSDLNKIDRLSEKLPTGIDMNAVNQHKPSPNAEKNLPSHVLGEALVLNVSHESSTAIITRSFAEIQLGDAVEAENREDASAEPAPAAKGPAPCSVLSRMARAVFLGHCGK